MLKNNKLFKPQIFLKGKWIDKSPLGTFNVLNPLNNEILASIPRSTIDNVNEACDLSMKVWDTWRQRTCKERSALLSRMSKLMSEYSQDLANIITLESGKPINEARGEVNYGLSYYDFYSEEAKRINGEIFQTPINNRKAISLKEPIGPAGIITPWNFPCAMITRKVGAAIAAGCPVIIKPSEETPLTALALCIIAQEAGAPEGLIQCLPTSRDDVIDIGNAICDNNNLRKISFTGSTNVGKLIMSKSSNTIKKVSLELGGNAPFIIFDDTDIDIALKALMNAKFRNAGQTCIAANRILIQNNIHDMFVEKLLNKVKKLKMGDGLDNNTTIGPLINQNAVNKVQRHVDGCVNLGGELLIGGKSNNNFYEPTIITNITLDMPPMNEEIFGPLAAIYKFDDEDEAISIANDTPFGLASYACTNNLKRSWKLSEKLDTGMIGLNEGAISSELAPFGGVKQSGLGREGSHHGIDDYCEIKYVCMGL